MTDLEKIKDQLGKAMSELKELNNDETQLAFDYIEYASILVENLILHDVINWVAVNERLPQEQTDVITYSKEFEVRNGRCMQKGSWFVNGYSRLVNVTHWAELPKPPCL